MALYKEDFPVGSLIRIADAAYLRNFQHTWKYHHPLGDDQLGYADRETEVEKVSFYHGGDVLYTLKDVPGIWHEQCLGAPRHLDMSDDSDRGHSDLER